MTDTTTDSANLPTEGQFFQRGNCCAGAGGSRRPSTCPSRAPFRPSSTALPAQRAEPASRRPRHWFIGDGMLHGVRLESGRGGSGTATAGCAPARSRVDPFVDANGTSTSRAAVANTNVIGHAGTPLALVESVVPVRAHPRARHRRPLRLRRPAHHQDDRAPQDRTRSPASCTSSATAFLPPYLTYHRARRRRRRW